MDKMLEFLKEFNVQTIISMIVIFWWFTRDIKSEMKLLEAKLDQQSIRTDKLYEIFCEESKKQAERTEKQSERSDRLYEMFIDLLKEKK